MNSHLKSVIGKLNSDSRTALDAAISHAAAHRHVDVSPEHLLLSIIQQAPILMESLGLQTGLPVNELLEELDKTLKQVNISNAPTPVFAPELVTWLVNSWLLASARWGQQLLSPAALMACLLDSKDDSYVALNVQQTLRCDRLQAQQLLQTLEGKSTTLDNINSHPVAGSALKKYTRNLSELARQGALDPVVGREAEIRQMVDILLRRRQNNPILTGEPGVGKTALAEGLAMRIATGTVPLKLKSMEVLTLDLGLLQAGASVKGEFENRLQSLLKEVSCAPQSIILFIDEAHTLIGAGGTAGQSDAANMLKPALARGELKVIAATTWAEYKKYFEKDAALARRFQVVKVAEPNIDSAITMLRGMAPAMSHHHGITVLESAIHAAVNLSSRYITARQLPDKAVSLLDTACARVAVSQTHEPKEIETITVHLRAIQSEYEALQRENASPEKQLKLVEQIASLQATLDALQEEWLQQNALLKLMLQSKNTEEIASYRNELAIRHQHHAMVFESVDATCVADVVSDWTGIPLGRMLEKEYQQLDALFDRLAGRIIGQEHALEQIARQINISRAGMNDPVKPTGVFMLVGPSGTGKTETSVALAELLFGGEQSLVTINMSEFQEAHSVSSLKGSPPGYVGYGQGGVLTEAVRRNPYRVILLDEVEKAHPDVIELFYQIFDKGTIDDAEGQSVDFRNTLIIMTSNLASASLVSALENKELNQSELCSLIRPEFDQVFSPALMGRMTLIPYLPLRQEALAQIIELKLQRLCQRYERASESKVTPTWSHQVVTWVAEHCQVKQSGARDIDQVLNQHLLPLLAARKHQNNSENAFTIDVSAGAIVLLSCMEGA
ncbi:type VI secretion system ATPase TssH [Buttiauxella sp. S19-1]|uniref:type VI secretion system ATPase TssH n=1 Tax=Buttiauxella sp. S19-1 TaxID=941430 RepID=UPI001ED9E845|nr:type VI secretion system ATPase TssH [Buttiauxella sp. S19-1]